jgi:antitoxin (DNA-binding transcriptional repressor) of toxin-antitoxin stability system
VATVTLEEAQAHLAEIIARLAPGAEVVLTRDDKPVATIKATPPREAPRLGTLKGTVLSMEHFDDPLEEFEEYM